MNKIAIFDEVNHGYIPIIDKYLSDGFTVYFLGMDVGFEKQKYIQRYLEANKLVNLSTMIFHHLLYSKAAFYAHKNLDHVFSNYFSKSRLIKITNELLKSPEIENMYKKELLKNLQQLYENELRINEISKDASEVYFYPSRNLEIHLEQSLLPKKVKIINYKNFRIKIKHTLRKLRDVFALFFPLYLLLKKTGKISLRKTQKKYKIGLQLSLPGLFSFNYHYINFIIDDIYKIPKNEILLIDVSHEPGLPSGFLDAIFQLKILHRKSHYIDEAKKMGYDYTNITKTKEALSLNLLWNKLIKSFLPAWLKCLSHSFLEQKINIDIARVIITDYIKWNIFADGYSIKNHINILLPDTVSKNLVLSSNDIKTWFIYPDNSAGDYHSGWDEKIPVSLVFSFMNPDYAVIYGDKIRRYFNYNRNNIKNYSALGVLPSQRVRELQEGKLASELAQALKKKKMSVKIIGVFDTSYADNGVTKIKDGIRFGKDIFRLLDEMPEICVIFKEKKFRSFTPQLASVYEKLEKHERCIFVRKTEKDCIFSTEVIALSDLVISAAYTSTAAEALGAEVKSIYYDMAGNDIGENYYFNRFPNLVAHNYEELKRLVNYWLYEVTDEQFENFLNTYVKGEIDPYLDGKAIDRLHTLLMKE